MAEYVKVDSPSATDVHRRPAACRKKSCKTMRQPVRGRDTVLVEHRPEGALDWRVVVETVTSDETYTDPIEATTTKSEAKKMARAIAKDLNGAVEIQNMDGTWKEGPNYRKGGG